MEIKYAWQLRLASGWSWVDTNLYDSPDDVRAAIKRKGYPYEATCIDEVEEDEDGWIDALENVYEGDKTAFITDNGKWVVK